MRPFNNYETTQTISARAQLPVGAYICRILKAEEKVYNSSKGEWHKLEISFDISEGEHKDFYANDYKNKALLYRFFEVLSQGAKTFLGKVQRLSKVRNE